METDHALLGVGDRKPLVPQDASEPAAAIGRGVIDWKLVFAAAGVQRYFVDVPAEAWSASYEYLHRLDL